MFALFGQTLKMLFSRFGTVMGITLLVLLPIAAVELVGKGVNLLEVVVRQDPQGAPAFASTLFFAGICTGVLAIALGFLYPWMEGALTHFAIERKLGRSPGVIESYRATRPLFGPLWLSNLFRQLALLVLSALVGLVFGLMATLVLNAGQIGIDLSSTVAASMAVVSAAICAPLSLVLIVVSLLLAVNWSLRAPVIVGEGAHATEALGRSNALVRGQRIRMMFRLLPLALLEFIVVSVPTMLISGIVTGRSFGAARLFDAVALNASLPLIGAILGVGALLSLFAAPFGIIYLALNYIDLRVRKEDLAKQLEPAPVTAVIERPVKRDDPYSSGPFSAPLTPAQKIAAIYNRLRLEGDTGPALKELGRAYVDVGDLASAIEAYERARLAAPDDAEPALALAQLHDNRKERAEARGALSAYLALESDAAAAESVRNSSLYRSVMSNHAE
jgi:hypothetical protein